MNRHLAGRVLLFCLLGAITAALLSADRILLDGPTRLRSIATTVAALCCDPGIQWMITLCLACDFAVVLILEFWLNRQNTLAYSTDMRIALSYFANRDFWLTALIILALLRYALVYHLSAHSAEVPVFLTGIVFGKAMTSWADWGTGRNKRRTEQEQRFVTSPSTRARCRAILVVILALLAGTALWEPPAFGVFQYHGIIRRTGVFENPNLYGLLMGTGVTLSLGLGSRVWGLWFWVSELGSGFRHLGSAAFYALVIIVCGVGLFESYSRGAWVGTATGLTYLAIAIGKGESRRRKVKNSFSSMGKVENGKRKAEISFVSRVSWFYRNRFPLFGVILSMVVLLFWQCDLLTWTPLERAVSVTNPDDFSSQNRVTAWKGAMQMIADKPFFGFGWGQAHSAYQKDYLPMQLTDGGAIEMNDYFMLGATLGIPALFCFGMYLWRSLVWRAERGVRSANKGSGISEVDWLQTTCRAGAVLLLVGFWFDGGLFRLATASIFWILLELGNVNHECTQMNTND